MIPATLGHYRILDKLGEGGMGEVYRARDDRLGREVAIKVLPADVAHDTEKLARFEQEAKAVAALSHPNILAIHDLGDHEGAPFIVTELLRGESLREALSAGRLPTSKTIEYSTQIATALAAAHDGGIVHRDLKPENVFITGDGQVKVLDFGLAKLVEPEATATLDTERSTRVLPTAPGTVMGTLGYMSPEQLRGRPVDHRADIFALGSLLYEMLAGRRPFGGRTAAETSAAVLADDPAPLPDTAAAVPAELEQIVRRCLEKRPQDRFQSARDLAFALSSVGGRTAEGPRRESGRRRFPWAHALAVTVAVVIAALFVLPPEGLWHRFTGDTDRRDIRSIAVLPLDSLSTETDQEYFAEGMTDELITRLAQIGSLDVISRTSVMRFRDSDESLPDIARELGVDAIVEGSVTRDDEQIRITVQLIDGGSDRHLWADSYQRPLHDVLTLQSEIARAVAREIDVALSPEEVSRLAEARPVDPRVHEAYLRGMHHVLTFTGEGLRIGIESLESAIELDPTFAPAHAGLGVAYANLTYFAGIAPTETFPRARASARRALELDENLATALTINGWIAMVYEWDWRRSEHELERSLALMPSSVETLQIYSWLLSCTDRHDEAIATARRAIDLDPLSLMASQQLGMVLFLARRYEEAIAHLETVIRLHPEYWFAYQRLAMVVSATGNHARGIETIEKGIELSGPATVRGGREVLGPLLAVSGRRQEALAVLADFETLAEQIYVPPTDIARIHTALGNRDEAFQWLDRAVELRDADLFMTRVWPVWDPIRDDPRFDDLLRRLNLAE